MFQANHFCFFLSSTVTPGAANSLARTCFESKWRSQDFPDNQCVLSGPSQISSTSCVALPTGSPRLVQLLPTSSHHLSLFTFWFAKLWRFSHSYHRLYSARLNRCLVKHGWYRARSGTSLESWLQPTPGRRAPSCYWTLQSWISMGWKVSSTSRRTWARCPLCCRINYHTGSLLAVSLQSHAPNSILLNLQRVCSQTGSCNFLQTARLGPLPSC